MVFKGLLPPSVLFWPMISFQKEKGEKNQQPFAERKKNIPNFCWKHLIILIFVEIEDVLGILNHCLFFCVSASASGTGCNLL